LGAIASARFAVLPKDFGAENIRHTAEPSKPALIGIPLASSWAFGEVLSIWVRLALMST
jgi:hypothetical protein